ncbi:hypothetical protein RHAL1_04128 [Beijerinckiaceae bacterium RH AL1]|nr:hypothetical protein RHCH11_RHCH11_04050 [Beijerinckiaceae bacterium RH CH11]VVB50085.1 hypothetical protein RHAL8_04047 [Beijerinckiaceae bacterium RH AL8]VVC57189.1 hypothetical protein RHAL1_04128 [Beijerinckiaceae bacterium RH AL1]
MPQLSSARLLECLVVAAAAGVLAWVARGVLRDGLVMVASLFVGLALIEGGVLVLDAVQHYEPPAVGHDSGLSQGRPLVGWGPVRPGVYRSFKTAPDGHLVFDTHVTIDANLDRRTVSADGGRPIVFFGDSWIYGDGVEDDGTLPQLFADLNHRAFPVLNLSFAGWSPAQNLLALREGFYRKLIDRPRHFILFTSPFHLERIACKGGYFISGAPRFVPDGDDVRYVGPCAKGRGALAPFVAIASKFALYRRIEPLLAAPRRDDVALYLKIVEAFVAQAKKDYGVETTVLFAPFDDGYLKKSGFTEAQIVDAWRNDGLDVLVDHLPKIPDESLYWIAGEGHPTALANKARAAEIEAHLREVDPAALDVGATR